ncbi:MAG TPA: amidase [Burkholderiaceae bacterium]|nr:amidase [Burkholderiaceae bacterium]
MVAMSTVEQLAADLAAGRTSARALVEAVLERIADPQGEGARAFTHVNAETARWLADTSDAMRRRGIVRSPVEGLPVSVKDLFDVAGEVTRAGSALLADSAPATRDATAVARLRAAGAVIVGRTNMVEFAFGGVGLNPHTGTPRNPWDRATGRVPGGSSSGAGVAQADGMSAMSLGTDTRGSVRIPAALCGVVGFKPTARRVPTDGAFPLSWTLDSIGPLANSVACCATYDAILTGSPPAPLVPLPLKGLRLLVPQGGLTDDLDDAVARAFEAALASLARAGAHVVTAPVPPFDAHATYFQNGGIAGAEAYVVHRPYLDRLRLYDPRVGQRIALGAQIGAADYIELVRLRATASAAFTRQAAPFDAVVMPTLACVAPAIEEVGRSDDDYVRWNLRLLRNAGVINFLDGCALTLPCHEPGSAPVGLTVCGPAGTDRHVLAAGAAIERACGPR